jgi:hypothetical protein
VLSLYWLFFKTSVCKNPLLFLFILIHIFLMTLDHNIAYQFVSITLKLQHPKYFVGGVFHIFFSGSFSQSVISGFLQSPLQ